MRDKSALNLRISIAITSGLPSDVYRSKTRLTSTLSIVPLPRDRFRGLVTNTIWLVSCSALDGLIGARLRSTYPGLLRRGAQTSTDDQEITEAGERPTFYRFSFVSSLRICLKRIEKFALGYRISHDVSEYERSLTILWFSFCLSFSVSLPLCLPLAAAVRSG